MSATAEFREIYFTKDRAPALISLDITGEAADNYVQIIEFSDIPPDDYKWTFQWPGGKVTFTWKTSALSWNQIQILGTINDCIDSAVGRFNSNYYFSKDFVALAYIDGGITYFMIKAKTLGAQFFGSPMIFGGYLPPSDPAAVIVNTSFQEPAYKLNHQAGIILFKSTPGLDSIGNNMNILVSEHIAPVVRTSEIIDDVQILFELQDPLHSLTEFKPSDRVQDQIIKAAGHTVAVTPAIFEIFGEIPLAERIIYFQDIIALRGGSRFENHNNYDPALLVDPMDLDFVNIYVKIAKKGVLEYSAFGDVTLAQEQYRYWFNYFETMAIKVKLTIVFKPEDGITDVISGEVYNFESDKYDVLIIPVGIGWIAYAQTLLDTAAKTFEDIDYYYLTVHEFWTDTFKANLGTFRIIDSVFGEKYFFLENSAGGGEVLRFTGEKSYSVEISKTEYQKMHLPWGSPVHRPFQQKNKAQHLVNYTEAYEASTGNLTRRQIQHYIDILISENVWEIIYHDDQGNNLQGYRFPILIEPGSFLITRDRRDGEYLYNLSFKYRRAYQEKSLGLVNNHG